MSVASRVTRSDDKESKEKPATASEIADLLALYSELQNLEKTAPSTIPSSILLQVLKYGKTFKRVIERVEYDLAKFYSTYEELGKYGEYRRMYKSTIYRHHWEKAPVDVPKEDVEGILKPLADLGLGDFTFKKELGYNEKFYEAIARYVEEGRVTGKVVFDENTKTLIIISEVLGSPKGRYAVPDVHYTVLVLEPSKAVFSCTCPWARGDVRDSRGYQFQPEYTSLCKHGLALLYYYYPEVAAYVKLASEGKLTKSDFNREVARIREAFEEMRKNMEDYITKHPDREGVVTCNVGYAITRELYDRIHELGSFQKFVPDVNYLDKVRELWSDIAVVRKIAVDTQLPAGQPKYDIAPLIKKMDNIKLYERIEELKSILNGLQGTRTTTLYTSALVAGMILGSDLETDPTIISVVGDPGTGKTLTADGAARLIGIRSIVIEKDVEESSLRDEALAQVSKNISRFVEFFEKVVIPKVPAEKREEAKKFFSEFIEAGETIVGEASTKKLVRFAKKFAETFTNLYGVSDKRTKMVLARLFYEILKFHKDTYTKYVTKEAVKRKAIEVRREMLQKIADLGLINRPEDKEEMNSGSVRWEVLETARGLRVRTIIDLHYALRKFGGDVDKLMEVLKDFEKSYNVYIKPDRPGIAELKLSESEYLEKAIKVREEDVLSPAKKLIWVGGELTKRAVILIDESRRAPWMLVSLLTDLSRAGRDARRTNLVITTDNAQPLAEAEANPELDAFHSRVNFEVITPSTTVAYIIRETLNKISRLEREGRVPLVYMDEWLLLNFLSEHVEMPERHEIVLSSVPLLLAYDFKILRPETAVAMMNSSVQEKMSASPLILMTPKDQVTTVNISGDYVEVDWGTSLPAIRMMPERRFGHHVERAAKALAITEKKTSVDEQTFLTALEMVLLARVIPADRQSPYLYLINKTRVVTAIVGKVREFLSKKETATEKLIDVLGSLSTPSPELLSEALDEMVSNPIATAVFVRFLEQMLASENASKFIEVAKQVPGLYKTLLSIMEYERIRPREA